VTKGACLWKFSEKANRQTVPAEMDGAFIAKHFETAKRDGKRIRDD